MDEPLSSTVNLGRGGPGFLSEERKLGGNTEGGSVEEVVSARFSRRYAVGRRGGEGFREKETGGCGDSAKEKKGKSRPTKEEKGAQNKKKKDILFREEKPSRTETRGE